MTEDHENNIVAAGAVFALLRAPAHAQLASVEVVTDPEGTTTNQIDITLSFMKSPYRITVERVQEES